MNMLLYKMWRPIVIASTLFLSVSTAVCAQEWPSKTFAEEYPASLEELLKQMPISPMGSYNMFSWVWNHATRSSPVDNRPYLFALAIDLYNSIPPDLMPEPRELAPGEDIYEPDNLPIKQQLDIGALKWFNQKRGQQAANWNRWKRKFEKEEFDAIAEKEYLLDYLREQIQLERPCKKFCV